MFERFTTPARQVVISAKQEAQRLGDPQIGTGHLLLGLLIDGSDTTNRLLRDAGIDPPVVERNLQRGPGPSDRTHEEDAAALRTIGIDLDAVIAKIEETFGPDAQAERPSEPTGADGLPGRFPLAARGLGRDPERPAGSARRLTPDAKKALALALREAVHLKHHSIGTEHLLLGLLRGGDGLTVRILRDAGIDPGTLRARALAALDEAA